MVNSDKQILIEKVITNNRQYFDSEHIKFLRHCTGCDLVDIPEEKRLENTLAMMDMRDKKMSVNEHLSMLFYNPAPYHINYDLIA